MSFSKIGVSNTLSDFLAKKGIETPTPVQEQAIPLAASGKDILVSAQTGTGKTYAYSLPLLSKLSENPALNLLVLVPTRELAQQVGDVIAEANRALKISPPAVLVGGLSFAFQASRLRQKPRVVVATPGRLMDHLRQRTTRLNEFSFLVLDEADRMLDMGFLPQVREICKALPSERQTLLFTATITPSEQKKMLEFLKNPERVFVDPPSTMASTVELKMETIASDDKVDRLVDLLANAATSALIFVRTKRRADRVADSLQNAGIDCDVLHGDRSQAQRQRAVQRFKQEDVRVLVATDVASRGLDIPAVGMVLNLDPPETREDLVHRNGRTGRAGAKGESITFIAPEELPQWKYLTGEKAQPMPRGPRRNQRDNSDRHHPSERRNGRSPQRETRGRPPSSSNAASSFRPRSGDGDFAESRESRPESRAPFRSEGDARATDERRERRPDSRPSFRNDRAPRFSGERQSSNTGFQRSPRPDSFARDPDGRAPRENRGFGFRGPREDRSDGRGDRPQRAPSRSGPRFGDKPAFASRDRNDRAPSRSGPRFGDKPAFASRDRNDRAPSQSGPRFGDKPAFASRDRNDGAPKKSRFRRFGAEPVSTSRG
jgi:superfamily II DNA/RNA helicase